MDMERLRSGIERIGARYQHASAVRIFVVPFFLFLGIPLYLIAIKQRSWSLGVATLLGTAGAAALLVGLLSWLATSRQIKHARDLNQPSELFSYYRGELDNLITQITRRIRMVPLIWIFLLVRDVFQESSTAHLVFVSVLAAVSIGFALHGYLVKVPELRRERAALN